MGYNSQMSGKHKPPPAEVSLAEVLETVARIERDRERDIAERKAERAEREAERKAERAEREAERKAERAEREAERKRDAEERKRERAEREAERKAERAEREAERKRDAEERKRERTERKAERKAERAEREAERAKWEAEREAERAKREEERKRDAAEFDRRLQASSDKHDREMKAIRDEVGSFSNGEGEILEDQAFAALWESRRIGNIRLTDIHQNKYNVVDGEECEYDIVAENGKMTVVLESKRTLRLTDVYHFIDRLSLFDKAFPEMAEGKTVKGGMIYQTVRNREETVKAALKAGLLLLHAEGKKGLRQVKSVADSGRPADRAK